jgi:hypothetical protein
MIRKFGTVDAPVEVVRRIHCDIASWPQWMPGVRAVRILAEVDRTRGRKIQTITFEFLFNAYGYRERQVAGMLKKWEADWRFQAGPNNAGTLVSCRLELQMGLLGLFAPTQMIQRWIDRTFEATLRGLLDQARLAGDTAAGEFESPAVCTSRIQVFATPTELEIWIGDRRYAAHAMD